jgi:toxin-antitoxin system PIN domain toxin
MIDLPDINLWIALSSPDHPHHEVADRYWREQSQDYLAFNSTTMLGLVRVGSTAPMLTGKPLSLAAAWKLYQDWRGMEQVAFLVESAATGQILDRWISNGLVTTRTLTDAYLAAFALGSNCRMVTFDQDYKRFPGLDLLLL